MLGFLDKSRTVAPAGYSRWMVPPAALCVHLCIGQAYAFSVFNLPMTKLIGITARRRRRLGSAQADRVLRRPTIGAHRSRLDFQHRDLLPRRLGGGAGPLGRGRRSAPGDVHRGAVLGGGFLISALGVYIHNIWLIYFGYGVVGGIGLGIGYISPVSTLIKWFPDRPGMATGMAIMGFGGGAFIASPLSVWLMGKFTTPTHVGVAETFIVMGIDLFLLHDGRRVGSCACRRRAGSPRAMSRRRSRRSSSPPTTSIVYEALKTPQFWLIWWVLCLNVTAGIGVLGQASAMSQEMFPGHVTAVAAAGFVGLMSLFNMAGRFFWASTSDLIGRKNTYFCFFVLGTVLYAARAAHRRDRQRAAVRVVLPHHHQHVWRRLRHRAGLSARHVRHALCRRHPRHAAHRLVGGGHLRPGAGELHPPITSRHGVAEAAGL